MRWLGRSVKPYSLLTVSFLRPLARRRFTTRRPFFVDIRTRNPCVRARLRLLGWNVRLPFIRVLRNANEHRSEGVRTVSNGMALCYSRRPFFPPRFMQVRSLTRVFHTCGKNCGNSQKNGSFGVRLAEISPKRVT